MATEELLKKYAFKKADGEANEEQAELHRGYKEKTGFPQPHYRYHLVTEAINLFVEEAYFWTMDELRHDWGFNVFHKITDASAAAVGSSFFGLTEQRLGMQQDKASQYLKGISEMLKALFQLVREMRIIDERIGYYEHSFKRQKEEEAIGSDITLKGIWVDQVEGGTKNAGSVYGLANTVGFTVLPDLFFRVRADDRGAHEWMDKPAEYDRRIQQVMDDLDRRLANMEGFNNKVKEVLGRKLTQYYMWKMRTYRELKTRRTFSLKYLRQHYDTIKLYTGWVKPYLRNIKRLAIKEEHMDSAEMITSFEGAVMEIEVLSVKKQEGKPYHPCILANFFYRVRPSLEGAYMQEGYQRGPKHTGKFDMTLRGYVWSDNEIENYRRMREEEDLDLLSEVDASIHDAMDALGSELKQYLKEAGEKFPDDDVPHEAPQRKPGALEPFAALVSGFKELAMPFAGGGGRHGHGNEDAAHHHSDVELDVEYGEVKAELKRAIWQTYKDYKKLHGMLVWG